MSKLTYADAGVSIEEGYRAVDMMKKHVQRTFTPSVLTGLGSFGALFKLDMTNLTEPVLVAGTDGVGTKLKIAFLMDRHDTVGEDAVAMCVNDVLCQGATPLFFLDYIATGKLDADVAADIVKGVAEGCIKAGCSLIGGETAEMPGFYAAGEYDIAGFAVGVVDRSKIIDGSKVAAGDILYGLPSSGVHSNGFSLVRKLFFDKLGMTVNDSIEGLPGTLGEALLTPTRIYVKPVLELMKTGAIHGMAHITGGGFHENIPRMYGKQLDAKIQLGSWPVPPVFQVMAREAALDENDLYNTFNMGIGLVIAVDPALESEFLKSAEALGETVCRLGEIVPGTGVVQLWK